MKTILRKRDFEAEMVRRGYHVVPRRCTTCGGNHGLELGINGLVCGGCGRLEKECKCK